MRRLMALCFRSLFALRHGAAGHGQENHPNSPLMQGRDGI